MSEMLGIALLLLVMLVYEISSHAKEHRQMNALYDLNRRAISLEQTVRDKNGSLKKHKRHYGPRD